MARSSVSELERLYFVEKAGGADRSESLGNIKRRYWLGLFGGDRNTGMTDLEKQWLVKIITDAGETPSSNELSTLYVEAVVALGGDATQFINENRKQVFILDF